MDRGKGLRSLIRCSCIWAQGRHDTACRYASGQNASPRQQVQGPVLWRWRTRSHGQTLHPLRPRRDEVMVGQGCSRQPLVPGRRTRGRLSPRAPAGLGNKQRTIAPPSYMWNGEEFLCPDTCCSRLALTFSTIIDLVRHLVLVHLFYFRGQRPTGMRLAKLDEHGFAKDEDSELFLNGSRVAGSAPPSRPSEI
jgi:hypothetical protein